MLLDTLKTVLSVYGPTGQETQVAECIKGLLAGHADSVRTDVMGNLIVEKKGQAGGKTIMFSAHMDHIGLVVTDIEDTGYLRVTNVGWHTATPCTPLPNTTWRQRMLFTDTPPTLVTRR